jgi:hypothetical protein
VTDCYKSDATWLTSIHLLAINSRKMRSFPSIFILLVLNSMVVLGAIIQRDDTATQPCEDGGSCIYPAQQTCCYAVDGSGNRLQNDEGRGILMCENGVQGGNSPSGYTGTYVVYLCPEGYQCTYNIPGAQFPYQAGCLYYLWLLWPLIMIERTVET